MKKLDIRKDIQKRKYKKTNPVFYFIYWIVMKIKSIPYHAQYTYIDDIRKYKGPAFVVFNHLSRIDHAYVLEACWPRRMNMLCEYNEFFRSHLHFAFKHNNILPKKNYAADTFSLKAMISIIKQNGLVALAPEGLCSNDGLNKPIVPKTGSLFKHFKIPVYFIELRGQYLQNHKVSLDERYGKTFATVKLLFSADDLEKMSVEEIDDKINEAFRHDEYKWQKEQHIKWNVKGGICERYDDMLFWCPSCHSYFEMEGKGNSIRCKKCGNGATMDEYYDLHPFNDNCKIFDTPSDWTRQERINVIKEIRNNPNFSFSENVSIGRLPNDHYLKDYKTSEVVAKGVLTIDHEGMRFVGTDTHDYDFFLTYKEVYTLITSVDSSYFNVYVKGEYTDIFPERHTSLYINMLIEEMHRLHVNYYKNFPWNAYMYDEK